MSIIYKKTQRWTFMILMGFFVTYGAKAQSDNTGERRVTGTYIISNANVISPSGKLLPNTSVLVRNGIIAGVGSNIRIPANAQEIKGDSLFVYPGFIDGGSSAGITKPKDPERPSNFNSSSPPDEIAGITPYRNAVDQFDTQSSQVSDWRKIGFTMAQILPDGGMLPGKTALVVFGEKGSTNVYSENTALYATFNSSRGMYPGTLLGVMAKFRNLYRNAELSSRHSALFASNQGINRPERDKVMEAFYPTLDQGLPILFAVEDDLTVRRALSLQKELGFKMILSGAADVQEIIPLLKESQTSVFLSLNLPDDKASKIKDNEESDTERKERIERVKNAYKKSLEEAGKFEEAGIPFGFTTQGIKSGDLMKNIRLMIENGLSEEAALAALTINSARILGIDRYAGTIEQGKLANLVVTTDSLFKEDSQVKHVFADGYLFDYDTKAKRDKSESDEDVDLAGTWEYVARSPQGESEGIMVITKEGEAYSGEITLDNPAGSGQITTAMNNIEYSDNRLRFEFSIDVGGNFLTFSVSGDIDGNEFDGDLSVTDLGSFPFKATKQPGA
ncbi:MAG TPA: amidohydrolase family protein [Anditalea sp.]|nr:amidohydrolase family protein [Anditalea sp.]